MKEFLKDNSVTIFFGVLGSAGLVGSIAAQVQTMAAAYSCAFWMWTFAMLGTGWFLGTSMARTAKARAEARRDVEKDRIAAESMLEAERMKIEAAARERAEAAEAERTRAERARKEEADRRRAVLLTLPWQQKAVVGEALENGGTVARPTNDDPSHALAESGVLVRTEAKSGFKKHWKIADGYMAVIHEGGEVVAKLVDAKATADAEARRLEAARLRSEFESLGFPEKLLVYGLLHSDERRMDDDEVFSMRSTEPFVSFEDVGRWHVASLKPEYREFFAGNPDLFRRVEEYLDEDQLRKEHLMQRFNGGGA